MTTHSFVLIHGAWHGAWCWEAVAALLTARGHRVDLVTQTGLGEKAHLITGDITLETFVTDVVEALEAGDHQNAVLVGHSFGGVAIMGAAERATRRIRRLICLDSLVVDGGQAPFDLFPEDVVAERRRLAQESSGGVSMPVPEPSAFDVTDPAEGAWVARHLTPHPFGTYATPLPVTGELGAGLPIDYIYCNGPLYRPAIASHDKARQKGWRMHPLSTTHDAMITAPHALAEMLLEIADSPC
ncbi:MAG: alpha/beta hydrolase family protein [Pseudomonadota bacterium]